MTTEIRLPQWGMGMRDGTVQHWLKREGEAVHRGEPLVEVEAAKVTGVVESEAEGILLRILVPEGTNVPVRTPLCVVGTPSEGEAPDAGEPAPRQQPQVVTSVPATVSERVEHARIQVTPVARKLAKDHAIDLEQVAGSGPGGRITEEDVRRAIVGQTTMQTQATSPEKRTTVPLTGMRGVIAQRMHESLQAMAQVTLMSEIDATELIGLRERLQGTFSLSYTDLIVKSVAMALRAHPRLNAWIEGQEIHVWPQVHVGVAVALDEGLVVPVLRDVERKSLREVARESQRLIEGARTGTLKPEEVSGSTLSVTNLGMYGIDAFTPIINPPEVAVLGIGRIVERAVREQQGIAWRQMLTLSLTFDHRAVDGAPAAAFLQAVRDSLEHPVALAEDGDNH